MMAYLWIKAFHVISVIAWMAGLLYLPRLFVYHAGVAQGSEAARTFEVMERRLLRVIMNPAMVGVWLSGLFLAWRSGFYLAGWFHAKLGIVLILSGFHGFLAMESKSIAAGRKLRNDRFYRIINEIPTLLMIIVVCLVVVKPF